MPHFLIDNRIGSAFTRKAGKPIDYIQPLKRAGLPVKPTHLSFGDFAFFGNGPDGLAFIGVERKTVSEVVGSIGNDARLVSWQIPGMLKRYDYRYLIVEGWTKVDKASGVLQSGYGDVGHTRDRHLYVNYKRFLLTLQHKAGFRIEHTSGFSETVFYLAALFGWWQKRWKDHHAAYRVHESRPDTAILDERTFKRQTFAQWPGIGWEYSKRVSEYFPTVAAAVDADEQQWAAALGIVKGRTIIKALMLALHGPPKQQRGLKTRKR